MKGLSINKTVVLKDDLGILVTITYKHDFNLTKWLNKNLTEQQIVDWVEKHKWKDEYARNVEKALTPTMQHARSVTKKNMNSHAI